MDAIRLDKPQVSAYTIPVDTPESDDTLAWNSTTLVVVNVHGLGYSYANGAYSCTQALEFAEVFIDNGVSWFEEPVSSDDLEGLRLLRDRAPFGMDIAAGEYGYDAGYFRRMLQAGAVDALQADTTRCAGITGFLQAAALADVFQIPLSAHCAPSIHAHPACAVERLRHIEYIHDHVRIEQLLFDGVLTPERRSAPPICPPETGTRIQVEGRAAMCHLGPFSIHRRRSCRLSHEAHHANR
jgi:hypothetical protein